MLDLFTYTWSEIQSNSLEANLLDDLSAYVRYLGDRYIRTWHSDCFISVVLLLRKLCGCFLQKQHERTKSINTVDKPSHR